MSAVLITGGTGFLGEHLVQALLDSGARDLRVLVRGTYEPIRDDRVAILRGDVVADRAPGSDGGVPLDQALRGCDRVYHLAGVVSRDASAGQAMMRVHVDGTRRLFEEAARAGVKRIVVASSSGTIAVSRQPEPVPDESAPYATDVVANWPYYLSKIYQEKLALELGAQLGLEVVIVNPSLLLGPGDRRRSSTGDVLRFLKRQIPIVPDGGVSFVDVRDAAQATIAAMERGRPGERYLLGGPNWSCKEFFGRLARASKVRGPWLTMPRKLSRAGATVIEELYRTLDREPPVDRISVEMSEVFWYCDSSKARAELGFDPRDPAETLDDTIRWLRAHERL
jgi:dihydroflavonol-4-reductase